MSISRVSVPLFTAAFIVAALASVPANAGDGEFRRVEGQLRCLDESGATVHPPGLSCLRIGPVRIGETLRMVAMKFGKARQSVNRGPVTERLYPIDVGVPQGQRVPYWVIGFEDQRVVSIQITGDMAVDKYGLSSVHVGDPETKLQQRFGQAGFSQPAPRIDGTLLGYPPYPVTFEIKDGRVYSMRVSEAIGK